jgi:hypothetical protein
VHGIAEVIRSELWVLNWTGSVGSEFGSELWVWDLDRNFSF